MFYTYVSGEVDSQESANPNYSYWSSEATKCLISLYAEFQDEMESTSTKKKDVWLKISHRMKEAGFECSVPKMEAKWRNLVKSHKTLIDNKKHTGSKRKTFQYFEEMAEILMKRHDINPPVIGGSGISKVVQEDTAETLESSDGERKKSNTPSAKKRRVARCSGKEGNEAILEFLKEIETQRKKEQQERERRSERAERRDRLLERLIEKL